MSRTISIGFQISKFWRAAKSRTKLLKSGAILSAGCQSPYDLFKLDIFFIGKEIEFLVNNL